MQLVKNTSGKKIVVFIATNARMNGRAGTNILYYHSCIRSNIFISSHKRKLYRFYILPVSFVYPFTAVGLPDPPLLSLSDQQLLA